VTTLGAALLLCDVLANVDRDRRDDAYAFDDELPVWIKADEGQAVSAWVAGEARAERGIRPRGVGSGTGSLVRRAQPVWQDVRIVNAPPRFWRPPLSISTGLLPPVSRSDDAGLEGVNGLLRRSAGHHDAFVEASSITVAVVPGD
jgi:hypothetical protein